MAKPVNEALQLEIDIRIADLWAEVKGLEEWDEDILGAFLRAAYGQGYVDALSEPLHKRGQLCTSYGYAVPKQLENALRHKG